MSEAPARLVVGRVLRPHGVRGEVTVEVLSDAPDRFAPGAELAAGDPEGADPEAGDPEAAGPAPDLSGGLRRVVVASSRLHQGRLLLAFQGIDDRTAADSLRGLLLSIPARAARPLEPGEYWPHQLVGLAVVDRQDQERGTVADVVPGTAHDLLSVRLRDGATALVPAVAALVIVDLDAGRVVVDALPGLLDPS
jgi:16S rRNA processing protein RimM